MLQESLRLAQRAAQCPVGVQLAQCEQFVVRAQKRLDSVCGTDAARWDAIAAREDPIGSNMIGGRAPGSPVGGRRSPARAGFSCCRERRFCRAGHHHGFGGFEFNGIDRRRGVEAASDGSHPHQWMTLRGARYGLRGVRVGEASHPGPPKNLLRLRRASSTRPEPRDVVISQVGSTVGDSDDGAPLVCSQREAVGVQQGMPITVGGRFTSLVEAGHECEEFDLTIADDVQESSVEVGADIDVVVATTAVDRHNSPSASLLDASRFGDGGQWSSWG